MWAQLQRVKDKFWLVATSFRACCTTLPATACPDPRHQSWNPLQLLRVPAASQGRLQDSIRRIGLPHSRNRHRDGHCQIGEWVFCRPASAAGSSTAHADNPGAMIAEQVIRIDVHKDRLIVRFKSASSEDASHSADGRFCRMQPMQPMQPAGILSESPAPGYRHSEK